MTAPIGAGLHMAVNADHRHRANLQDYWLVNVRVTRAFRHTEMFLDATNRGL